MLSALVSLSLIARVLGSNIPTLPVETVTAVAATVVGFSPKPTKAPVLGHELLFERQYVFSTCGYYNGQPLSCAAGYACATNPYNYAGCCPQNNVAACTIFISCVDYANFAAYGFNPFLYGFNTGICTNTAMPYCFSKIWNYATRYTELSCNTQPGYMMLDPNPDVASGPGPVNAPSQPSESADEPDPDTSGQTIDGDQNTQITGDDNNIIMYGGGDDDEGDSGDSGGGSNEGSFSRLHHLDIVISSAILVSLVIFCW